MEGGVEALAVGKVAHAMGRRRCTVTHAGRITRTFTAHFTRMLRDR
jgi:hypothetical protein